MPPVALAVRLWPARRLRRAGLLLVAAGIMSLVAVVAYDAITWLPEVPSEDRRYLGQRVLYELAMATELPVLQVTLAGVVCWWAGRRKGFGEP